MILAQASEIKHHTSPSDLLFVGVDEVGRGPLIGSVVAAAVVLDPKHRILGLNDSKKLSEKKRNELSSEIKLHAIDYAIAAASSQEIDSINILQASLLAMQRAVEALSTSFSEILIDGQQIPKQLMQYTAKAIVGGDLSEPAISAASILAKVRRDQEMYELDKRHPEYGFKSHKGYPTKAHLAALTQYGPLPEHRKSFKPVQRVLLMDA